MVLRTINQLLKQMRYALILSITLAVATVEALAQTPSQQRPSRPPSTTCCQRPALVPAFTGGNKPGEKPDRSASTADVAVIVKQTTVERTASGDWLFTVSIANDNGNNCTPKDNTRAILQLPPDCQVVGATANQADGSDATWTQCGAYLEVQLGQLCPSDGKIGVPAVIKVHLNASPYEGAACIPAFGVFAFSGMPDHVPGNNSWWWREHCTEGSTFFPKEQPLPTKDL